MADKCANDLVGLVKDLVFRLHRLNCVDSSAAQILADDCDPPALLVVLMCPSSKGSSDCSLAFIDEHGLRKKKDKTGNGRASRECSVAGYRVAAGCGCVKQSGRVGERHACAAAHAALGPSDDPSGAVQAPTDVPNDGTNESPSSDLWPRNVFAFDALALDANRRTATLGGSPLRLTKGQYDLLVTLTENEGRVVSYEVLHKTGCSVSRWTGDTRAVRQQIAKLARKRGEGSVFIENVRGVGYSLTRERGATACPCQR